jgi:hypothetical protein
VGRPEHRGELVAAQVLVGGRHAYLFLFGMKGWSEGNG